MVGPADKIQSKGSQMAGKGHVWPIVKGSIYCICKKPKYIDIVFANTLNTSFNYRFFQLL